MRNKSESSPGERKLGELSGRMKEKLGRTAVCKLFVYIPYQSCHKRGSSVELLLPFAQISDIPITALLLAVYSV